MKKILISLILILSLIQNLLANKERDSLINLLQKHRQQDTIRVQILFNILQTYWYDRNDPMFGKYNNEAMAISKKLGYTKGIVFSDSYLYLATYPKNKDTIKIIAEETLKLSETKGYKEGILLAYYEFMWYYYLQSNYEKAIEYFEKIKSGYTESMDIYIKLITYMDVILVYFDSGEIEKAKECLEIYSSIRLDPKKKSFNAYKLYWQMDRYMRLNDDKGIRQCYSGLLKISEEINDTEFVEKFSFNMAMHEFNMGHYAKSLELNYKALEYNERKGNKYLKMSTLLSMCWIYYLLKEFEKAEYYGLKSLQLSKEDNDTASTLLNCVNLGMIEIELMNFEKAADYFNNGLIISIEKHNPYYIGWNNLGLAMLADKKTDYSSAEKHYLVALKYINANGPHDQSYFYLIVANHFLSRKNIVKAKIYADSAYTIACNCGASDMIAKACEIFYKVYATKHNYKKAYNYLLQYNQLNDSIKQQQALQVGLINEYELNINEKEKEQKHKDLIKEKELKQQRLLRNIFIAGFIFIVFISIFIYRLYLKKQKANKILNNHKILIQEQNEELKHQNEEITTINNALNEQKELIEEKNAELRSTLEQLKKTQTELIQSEKMASLGQLIAGIAHEINTPLGAINSSIETIEENTNQSYKLLPELFHKLPEELLDNFTQLLTQSFTANEKFTSAEERQCKKAITKQLEDLKLKNPDILADTLIDLGICKDISPFVRLLQSKYAELILNSAYCLSIQHKNSRNIKTAVEKASKILFALKNYSRYSHSESKVHANVIEGIDTVLTLYHNQLKHGIEIVKKFESVPEISCFPDELNQVWTNLIHNSIYAMQEKGKLEIAVYKNDTSIIVKIKDNGTGISDEIKDRVFDAFFTTKPMGEGSGLGLDIVKKIVEKHGGTIDFESEKGKGTEFRVMLPIT